MKQMRKVMRTTVTMLLVASIILGMVGCGVAPKSIDEPKQEVTQEDTSRQEMEQIVGVLGGGQYTQDTLSKMDDRTLEKLAQSMLDKLEPPKRELFSEGIYEEDGSMKIPFDQVYPELVEDGTAKYDDESLLVKLSNHQDGKITDGMKAAGVAALELIVPMEKCSWYEAKLVDGTDAAKAIEQLRQLKEVKLVEYNFQIKTAQLDEYDPVSDDLGMQDDPYFDEQWYMNYCGIAQGYEAMTTPGGSSSVVVAVIDTGVDYDHEDLKNNIWVNTAEIPDNGIDDDENGYIDDYYGVNIVSGEGNGDDDNGHGTHVAGIIAAENNNIGSVGIAYNVKIMPVKAAMASGYLNQSDIAKAILYAFEMGAEVINMSFGGSACSIAVQDALEVAYTRCVLVASAGNDGMHNEFMAFPLPNYPAALTYVLGVMSVDSNGVESAFSNWDVIAYSNMEYEVYAPGEDIMSTLPNDRYGKLSGTSMAAPVVAAMAAILRSEYADRDMYPTKFIYGQLCCTSEQYATCIDPVILHAVPIPGGHNRPQIVNLHGALTKSPSPQVNMQDYAIFDSADLAAGNNGDGVIDAGETIALGLILRNRWGMSKDTIVTVDAKSFAGIDDPYITIVNPQVNYGSVGTYSTQDAGAIYTDELLTGWEHPYLIKIADNCPNDYIFVLNVNISCQNALDEEDTTTYKSITQTITMTVRNGVILPKNISEDMVLTKDNLYIIPDSAIIEEGVTVRVEAGTHIQFWSNDPEDPYGETYMAYLKVKGALYVEGTQEEPVYIYPSDLMDIFAVDIGASGNGYVSLIYADVTNLNQKMTGGHISYADHCTFRQNYADIYFRYPSEGTIHLNNWEDPYPRLGEVENSVFYKLNGTLSSQSCDTCIFVQCGLALSGKMTNNVFLDNYFEDKTDEYGYNNKNSSLYIGPVRLPDKTQYAIYYNNKTGTTYLAVDANYETTDAVDHYLRETFGGDHLVIETLEERDWLENRLWDVKLAVHWDPTLGQYVWNNGTPVADFLQPYEQVGKNYSYVGFSDGKIGGTWSSRFAWEIPGEILPESIRFQNYVVDLDMESVYQLSPKSTPVQLPAENFIYESTNKEVVTVSESGVVTPVGLGSADVHVYSKDRAVHNYVTVRVTEAVPLENLAFAQETVRVAAGETVETLCLFAPINTTRRNVTYTSVDKNVATVDATGHITGVAAGTTTIVATCEGKTATLEVTVFTKASYLTFENLSVHALLADGVADVPALQTSTGAELDLVWTSTDPEVAQLTENNQLQLNALGSTSILVTDRNSGLTATCLVLVEDTERVGIQTVYARDRYHYALMEDGKLYFWSGNHVNLITEDVQMMAANDCYVLALKTDGTLEHWYCEGSYMYKGEEITHFKGRTDIAKLAYSNSGAYFVLTTGGVVYAWGNANDYGQLGVGTTNEVTKPQMVMLENVVDVATYSNSSTYFLTEDGCLYYAGTDRKATKPTLMAEDIAEIFPKSAEYNGICVKTQDGRIGYADINSNIDGRYYVDLSKMDQVALDWGEYGIALRDGKVYTFRRYDYAITQVQGIQNAKSVYVAYDTFFLVTEDGALYGFSRRGDAQHFPGLSTYEPGTVVPIILKDYSWENVTCVGNNLDAANQLKQDTLQLQFNKAISGMYAELYADGEQVVIMTECDGTNSVKFYRSAGFTEGVTYELVIDTEKAVGILGGKNREQIRITFTYSATQQEESGDGTGEEVVTVTHPSVWDKTIERVLSAEKVVAELEAYIKETQYNPYFAGNAILNPISTDTEVSHWLRPIASASEGEEGIKIPLGNNYWGTTNEKAIHRQMIDYSVIASYGQFMYAPYLTEAPENTFPFVTAVNIYNEAGEKVTTVGNETITVRISFNRDMDTSIDLFVRFGSCYPYGDYEVSGKYIDARTWEGTYTLKTVIENGLQYWTISNGCSATGDLKLQLDQARFVFKIDTSAAQALIMQGAATDTGINLTWQQDDFDTLMGYNVYRATSEDGLYTRLNSAVIPADQMTFFDDTVEPGVLYYYNFTVVQTDLSESVPSGKISIVSKDTMEPDVYHSPVTDAVIGSNLVISATITDNLHIVYAKLYFRAVGESQWQVVNMSGVNAKYSAIIAAQYVTAAGLEYYLEAFDGVGYTYRGTAEKPYTIVTREPMQADSLGDVDGDGEITNKDALLLLYAINDKYNLTLAEFERADLNGDGELWAAEALLILRYVSGEISSLEMP